MKALSLCLAALCALATTAQAAPRTENPLKVYYQEMAASAAGSLLRDADSRDCEPGHGGRQSCVKVMCDQGGYNCGFSSNLEKVAELCRGGVEGECVDSMCKAGGFNCGFSSNLEKVAQLCKNANGRCVKAACAAGGFNCGFSSNLERVAQLCVGVSGSCVSDMCAQGGYNCGFSSNLEKVMQLCKR